MATTAAVLGNARLNNFRLNYLPAPVKPLRKTRVFLWINGVPVCYRRGSMTIRDALNDVPNTCSFELFAPTPVPQSGARVRVTIDSDVQRQIFVGAIQTDRVTFAGQAQHDVHPYTAIDDTWLANRRRPFGVWPNVSASTIVTDLVQLWAAPFTATHVQPGLPPVSLALDGTSTLNDALRQVARLVGAYFYWEDYDLHFFQEDQTDPPGPVTTGTFLHEPPITRTSDDSQIRTRILGLGGGAAVVTDIAAGETILPLERVEDAAYFAPGGGTALIAQRPDLPPTDPLPYTGTFIPPRGGAVVGPGIAPTTAPTIFAIVGAGLALGSYKYAYSWGTGTGETVPSPLTTLTLSPGGVPNPTAPLTLRNEATGSPLAPYISGNQPIGQLQSYTYSYSTKTSYVDNSETTLLCPNTVNITTVSNNDPLNPSASANVIVTVPCSTDGRVRTIWIWQWTVAGGSVFHSLSIVDNKPGQPTVSYRNASYATTGTQPGSNTTPVANAAAIANVPLGPAGTTVRYVYRTAVNGSALKRQQTISNNTTVTGANDTTPDAALGVPPVGADTSGLNTTIGQVNAGSTSIPTSGVVAFAPGGGWLHAAGDQWIRYTGLSGNLITGIPATGQGSITVTLPFGALLVPSPALLGVLAGLGGLQAAVLAGTPLRVYLVREDWEAIAALAARQTTAGLVSDGIYEYVISDSQADDQRLFVLCEADLLLHAWPAVTVTYDTRDPRTRSGKFVTIAVTDPVIDEWLMIQDVTISEIDVAPGLAPRYSVTASNLRYSLDDILRRLTRPLDGSAG